MISMIKVVLNYYMYLTCTKPIDKDLDTIGLYDGTIMFFLLSVKSKLKQVIHYHFDSGLLMFFSHFESGIVKQFLPQ